MSVARFMCVYIYVALICFAGVETSPYLVLPAAKPPSKSQPWLMLRQSAFVQHEAVLCYIRYKYIYII